MIDLDAPILPGVSAAGCRIGQNIHELEPDTIAAMDRQTILDYAGRATELVRYCSDSVDLWVTAEGLVNQIGVHGDYRGKLLDSVNLEMTIDDIERLIAPCAEDEEDNLIIQGIHGLVFDIAWNPDASVQELDFQASALRQSLVTWFFVFSIDD